MITPGGSVGTAFTKSATTRFNNSQVKAAQASMPLNPAAQASLRKQTSGSNPSGPAVTVTQDPNAFLPPAMRPPAQQANLPTGGAGLPPEAAQGFDPAVFQEQMLDQIVGSVRAQDFINSPRVKDAASSVRLKNFLNNTNTERKPDSRNLLQQVLGRIGVK